MIETSPSDITAWPPKTEAISTTTTRAPPRAASSAAERPEMPAPTMMTSASGAAAC